MRKLVKNQKGFTLIELMMVVAVIGILAAVLVPKMGGIKTNAKLAGVDSNMRQVEATVQGLIERYKDNGAELDDAIINALNGEDGKANEDDITNPFTDETGAGNANTFAVIVNAKYGDKDDDVQSPGSGEDYNGIIHAQVFLESADDKTVNKVVITPYDNNGDPMPAKTIKP